MSAYWKSIEYHCLTCRKPATAEVFNTFNASMGYFCKDCKHREIERLDRAETQPYRATPR